MFYFLKAVAMILAVSAASPALARIVYFPSDRGPLADLDFRLGESDFLLIPVQTYDEGEKDYSGESKGDPGVRGASLNRGFTRSLVKIISDANKTCNDDRVELRYRIDCLRVYYGWAADAIPDRSEYSEIKKILRASEKKLSAIVAANLDTTSQKIEPREGHKKHAKKLPPLRPVKKSAEKKAVKQAQAVVKETELLILRSGEDPARREEHFDAVADAVDSNLLILRSA